MYVSPSRMQQEIAEKAIALCKGQVLDVGAGSGFASLKRQSAGYAVTALDVSKYCIEAMKISGVKFCQVGEINANNKATFDTFLFLNSTVACQETPENIEQFLVNLHHISTPSARIIVHDGVVDPGVISYEW